MSIRLLSRTLLALLVGCGGGEPGDAATDVLEPDAVVADSSPDVSITTDVVVADSSLDVPVTADGGGGDGSSGERVRSCDEVSRFFNCEGDLHSCFQTDPSGDQGACDSPGQFCENWDNCRTPGSRRAVDWDCYCEGTGAAARWRCMVRATCASRRDGGA